MLTVLEDLSKKGYVVQFLNFVVKARIQSNIPLSQSADHVGDPILVGWDIDRFYGQTSSGFVVDCIPQNHPLVWIRKLKV